MSTAEIDSKLKEFSEKLAPLTALIGSGQKHLAQLEAQLKDVSFEVILGDPDANKRKASLKHQITDTKRGIESSVEDIEVVEELIKKLQASKSDAGNREKIDAFDSEMKVLLDQSGGIARVLAQLGPLLSAANIAAQKMSLISWNGGGQQLQSIWQNALGALITLHFDGAVVGFPTKSSYRSDTLAEVSSLRDYMKKHLERQRKNLAEAFKAGTVEDPGTLETDDVD